MTLERFLHSLFGNNLIIGRHVVRQLDCLRQVTPERFCGRLVDDLGCGDGKLTVLLAEILRPLVLRGFDVNPALVQRARSRGIEAEVVDLDEQVPQGELAVMWGVLHHLGDPALCLRRVSANYDSALIREPIRGASPALLELGRPLRRRELGDLIQTALPGAELHHYDSCVLAFWDCRSGVSAEPTPLVSAALASDTVHME